MPTVRLLRRYLNNPFEKKKLISVKNPGAHFSLKISANRGFGTYARSLKIQHLEDEVKYGLSRDADFFILYNIRSKVFDAVRNGQQMSQIV